jgi:hypothetical protein
MLLFGTVNLATIQYDRMALGVPESQRSLVAREAGRVGRRAVHRDWVSACQWIHENTPRDAIFLTPAGQQTFKWYSSRGEVITWKDAPQDAAGMAEWLRRVQDVLAPDEVLIHPPEVDPAIPYPDRQIALARKYGATYWLVDRRRKQPQGLPLVYPRSDDDFNASFAIYRIPQR